MKINIRLILFLVLVGLANTLTYGQTWNLVVQFDSDRFTLNKTALQKIDSFLTHLPTDTFHRITILGHTDADASESYNQQLAQKRATTVASYLMQKGIQSDSLNLQALGESVPIATNNDPKGKAKNRRVEITFTRKEPNGDRTALDELYKRLLPPPQRFCINPSRDTLLRGKFGTVLRIPANAFVSNGRSFNPCVEIELREIFRKSDMILHNLSTTTADGRVLESASMTYVMAKANGEELQLKAGKSIMIASLYDQAIGGYTKFSGNRDADSVIRWIPNGEQVVSLKLYDYARCGDFRCGGVKLLDTTVGPCPFFFCKITRYLRRLFNKENQTRDNASPNNGGPSNCDSLMNALSQFQIDSMRQAVDALNAPFYEKYGVSTPWEVRDTLRKLAEARMLQEATIRYRDGEARIEDLRYLFSNINTLGWDNCDRYAGYSRRKMHRLKVNLEVNNHTDLKMIENRRMVGIPSNSHRGEYSFEIPKDIAFKLVVIQNRDGQAYLDIVEIPPGTKRVDVDPQPVDLETFRERIKSLDN